MLDPGEISYGDRTFQDSHPGIIAALAHLKGLAPPAVDNCRVLELGCGTGFNLLAMSQSIPGGRFTGVDYSQAHIQRADSVATAIGARNVQFHCLSIDDYHAPANSFDYIIAHGVYSWVPAKTRDAILAIIQRSLSPHGLAYVSYNTHPGWHLRNLVRDGLRYCGSPAKLDQLTASLINPDSPYARAIRAEWANAREQPDYYLAHEYLVPNCDPLYFHEFVRHAEMHQLQFVAEARFFANSFAQIETTHDQLGSDPLQREQHLDWLVGRYFRQSVLCHAGLELIADPDPQTILDLNIARTAENPTEITDELFQIVRSQLDKAGVIPAQNLELPGMPAAFLAAVLWSGWRDGLWAIRADTPATTPTVSANPIACPLARLQASAGPSCTNRHHRSVVLTPEEQQLLVTLDGTPNNNQLLPRLAALAFLTPPAPATGSGH